MNEFIQVTVSPNARLDNRTILIAQELAGPAGIEDKQEIIFSVGQHRRKLQVKLSSSDKSKNSISMHPAVIRRSFLRSGRKYGIRIERDKIHLGPVVGIMAEAFSSKSKPFGSQSFFFKQLLSAGRRLGEICFVFSPYSINWNKKTIYGYVYTSGTWRKAVFPLPDVIYPRERGYSPAMRRIRRKLTQQGIKFINPLLIGKWETHQIISRNETLVPYLPDTRLVRNFDQVNRMVKRYRSIYLKPVTGSQGRNIIKVVKRKNSSRYQYQYQVNNQSYRGSASSLTGLRSSLRSVMGNRRYIAQKQINLLKTEGHIIDIRILVQKDHTGEWSTTGMACRVGRRGSITSNISAGGSGRKVVTVLRRKFADEEQVQSIINNIQFVAIEAAKTIENTIGSSGEMGVDIGIDKAGKAWFIEANLRPARQVFILIGEKKTRRKSVEKPMSYCRYLAGFR